jgi:YVTN family beta-propeller protein
MITNGNNPTASAAAPPSTPTKLTARETSVPVDTPSGVAVSPDGRRAYVANAGSPDHPATTVAVVDLGTQTVTATVRVPAHPMALAITPDGRRLVVASTGSNAAPAGTLTVIDTASRHVVSTIPLASTPGDVTVSPDGRTAWCVITGASTYSPGSAVAVDLVKATVVGSIPVGVDPDGVVVAPDGRRAYVANFVDNTISVIDTTTNTVVGTVATGAGPSGLAVDQRRHTVWVANEDESDAHQAMTTIDTNTLAATPVDLGPFTPGTGGASPVAMTPDGRHLIVGRYGANSQPRPLLDIVDLATRKVTNVITMPWPYHIAMTSDGHHAVMSSGNLWELDIP